MFFIRFQKMNKNRHAARTDRNEKQIVKDLRSLGYTVETGVNDIFVGGKGISFWYEIKDNRVLNKNGKIKESEIKPSQKMLRATWRGHYKIVSSVEQILRDMQETFRKFNL